MSELRRKRPVETYSVQVKTGNAWRSVRTVHDREEAILEAVALTGEHAGLAPVRVMGEIVDGLSNLPHPQVIWRHQPPPQPPPVVLFEQRRSLRVAARKPLTGERRAWLGLGGAALLGLLALSLYVGTHISMDHVRY